MFDFFNPHRRVIECTIRPPIGSIRIPIGGFVPTPEHEERGITAEAFKEFIGKSYLHRTPPALRRRLLEAVGAAVPQAIVVATAHLPEFGGAVPPRPEPQPEPRVAPIPKVVPKQEASKSPSVKELSSAVIDDSTRKGRTMADGLREYADAVTSSHSLRRRRPTRSK